ncbi:hypothetical protein [Mesorhizobium sp. KR9-304]|uniref:hypothetical protein n=1 Tax=Mesorhizobium sp. KR9-304 TaxID=3156614 RepID=UPI0032B3296B
MSTPISIDEEEKYNVERVTRWTLHRMLEFRASHDLTRYLLDQARTNHRQTAAEMHANYPIKGVGVKATRASLTRHNFDQPYFIIDDQPLAPEDLFFKVAEYPLDGASCSYLFTLVEEYGNFMVRTFYPDYPPFKKVHTAWHHGVYAGMNLRNPVEMQKAKAAFTRPFGDEGAHISPQAIRRLRQIKEQRNSFAHEAREDFEFKAFFENTIAIVCHIYFLCMPDRKEIGVYPFEDILGTWR